MDDPVAESMRNFTYAIGDRETGEAVLVDPAYRPDELLELLASRRHDAGGRRARRTITRITWAGRSSGQQHVDGVRRVARTGRRPGARAGRAEVEWIVERTGVSEDRTRCPRGR